MRKYFIQVKNENKGQLKEIDGRPYTLCGVKCFVHKDGDFGSLSEHVISHFDIGLQIAKHYNFSQMIIIAKQRLSHPKAEESIKLGKQISIENGFTLPINK